LTYDIPGFRLAEFQKAGDYKGTVATGRSSLQSMMATIPEEHRRERLRY
jgi:hypothetical protein